MIFDYRKIKPGSLLIAERSIVLYSLNKLSDVFIYGDPCTFKKGEIYVFAGSEEKTKKMKYADSSIVVNGINLISCQPNSPFSDRVMTFVLAWHDTAKVSKLPGDFLDHSYVLLDFSLITPEELYEKS